MTRSVLLLGDYYFLTGVDCFLRDLNLFAAFWALKLHARAALGSPNLGQEVPVAHVLERQCFALVTGIFCTAARRWWHPPWAGLQWNLN